MTPIDASQPLVAEGNNLLGGAFVLVAAELPALSLSSESWNTCLLVLTRQIRLKLFVIPCK